mmetsp:Transcript_12259/g.18516  ORF Transcript_12259/g.18516 Transcript_12259/m.18516 type:complete len:140 (-) Transcript_12259:673-1092(-)
MYPYTQRLFFIQSEVLRLPVLSDRETDLKLFGESGRTEGSPLDVDVCLALLAFHSSLISETFHSKNVTKVDSGFTFARGAGTIDNFVIWEDELISDFQRTVVDEGGTKGSQNNGVDTNDGFDHFEAKTEPENAQNRTHW